MTEARKVLILMSDTGGGHRAAAEAIEAALTARHGDNVAVKIVDVFREYAPFPLKYAPEIYPVWINRGRFTWRLGYRVSNQRRQAGLVSRSLGLAIRRGLRRLFLVDELPDVVVCVHPFFVSPVFNFLQRLSKRPPYITVVTDLVSTHSLWYARNVERVLVPTKPAYDRALKAGVRPERVRITGLPVHPRFAEQLLSKEEARQRLEWDKDLPTILLIGGGQGMGPLFRISRRINRLSINFQLVIVAGRNEQLHQRLKALSWKHPVHVYGFVSNMPELMAAADLLVTKAGPATISEACIAGLPMILSDAIPGQETGNVRYIKEHQAGVYAPGSIRVARAVKKWLSLGPEFLAERAKMAHQLARPDAVWQIADEIWELAQLPLIVNPVNPLRRERRPTPRIRRIRIVRRSRNLKRL